MHNTNSLSPERMTQDQRLMEVANIMAEGLIRLRMPIEESRPHSDSDNDISLAIPAYRSVHANAESTSQSEVE